LNKALKPFEVCVHSTRRKFASDNSDILNVFELQDVLGHSSIETTKLYVSTNSKSILEKLNSKHEAV
jgi:integrase